MRRNVEVEEKERRKENKEEKSLAVNTKKVGNKIGIRKSKKVLRCIINIHRMRY
jgi:hypothetical protein